jgi:proton glutamate symport protein
MSRSGVGKIALIVSSVVILLSVADWKLGLDINPTLMMTLRWGALVTVFSYAVLRKSLTFFILIAMLIGAELGHDFPAFAVNLQPLSKIFIKLIKTIIAPLLFATLVVGIAGHSNLKQVGRMGWKSLVYFEIVTTIALFIGLAAINISEAGIGIPQDHAESHADIKAPPPQTWQDIVLHVFPENIAKSVAEGQVLQIVIFSIIFGIAMAMVNEKHRSVMLEWTESLAEIMFKFTKVIMYYVPIGVGAAIAVTVAKLGLDVFGNLIQLLATLYAALLVFLLGILLPIALAFRVPIRQFIKAISEPVSIAFATTSSEAALPRAMEAMIKFGVPPKIVAFVMPTGYSFNLDGTTLYLSLASVFVAQAAGIHLTWEQQLIMVFTLMLTSKGVAGVPRASLVILLGTAASFHLPEWPIFVILGIDELMDMARTSVNVIGNCLATVVVAKWEGEFDAEAPFRDEPQTN